MSKTGGLGHSPVCAWCAHGVHMVCAQGGSPCGTLTRDVQKVVNRSAYLEGGITEKFCPYCSMLWETQRGETERETERGRHREGEAQRGGDRERGRQREGEAQRGGERYVMYMSQYPNFFDNILRVCVGVCVCVCVLVCVCVCVCAKTLEYIHTHTHTHTHTQTA